MIGRHNVIKIKTGFAHVNQVKPAENATWDIYSSFYSIYVIVKLNCLSLNSSENQIKVKEMTSMTSNVGYVLFMWSEILLSLVSTGAS